MKSTRSHVTINQQIIRGMRPRYKRQQRVARNHFLWELAGAVSIALACLSMFLVAGVL